jgi:putative intracellular protease/amidase
MKKVLFVVTSHEDLGNTGRKTGVWLEEFVAPYYHLSDAGIQIDIVTPKGGAAPIDPMSEESAFQTDDTKRFYNDKELQNALANTLRLAEVSQDGYAAVFYPGGHGPLYDLAEDPQSIALIESFHANNKWIGAVCHGPGALKNVKNADGTPIVKGKKVNAFANTEEEELESTKIVPFSTEDMLRANGGIYVKTDENWAAFAVEDYPLITGQNPASSKMVAEMLLQKLS